MACKPRQIIGSDPLAAIPKDYNRYCDKIIGNAGGLFIDPSVLTRAAEIEADGGTVEDIAYWDSFVKWAKYNTIMPFWADIVAGYSPSWGVKGTTTASKLYSIIAAAQDLAQVAGAKQPAITAAAVNGRTGLIFDGVDDMMAGTFTYARPETVILMGFKQITWTSGDRIFDSAVNLGSGALVQSVNTPELKQKPGSGPVDAGLAVNTAGHVRSLFNSPTSNAIQVDGNAENSAAIAGVVDMDGFALGSRQDDQQWSNINVSVALLLNSAIDANYAAKMAAIYAFSKEAYATP